MSREKRQYDWAFGSAVVIAAASNPADYQFEALNQHVPALPA